MAGVWVVALGWSVRFQVTLADVTTFPTSHRGMETGTERADRGECRTLLLTLETGQGMKHMDSVLRELPFLQTVSC